MGAGIRHHKTPGGSLHAQMRLQEAFSPEANSKDTSWERLSQMNQGSDKMTGGVDGGPPDFRRASQSMPEEC